RSGASFAFSPSGDWFVTVPDKGVDFWRSGTWEAGPKSRKFSGPVAFSRGGDLFAMTEPPSTIVLVSTTKPGECVQLDESEQTIVRLENPDRKQVHRLAFSHDGRKLAAISLDQLVFVWDLGLISQGLSSLNLKGQFVHLSTKTRL